MMQGIEYIHKSKLKSHGRLKSTNCCIDGRWVLKVTDFGLNALRDVPTEENERYSGECKLFFFYFCAGQKHKNVHLFSQRWRKKHFKSDSVQLCCGPHQKYFETPSHTAMEPRLETSSVFPSFCKKSCFVVALTKPQVTCRWFPKVCTTTRNLCHMSVINLDFDQDRCISCNTNRWETQIVNFVFFRSGREGPQWGEHTIPTALTKQPGPEGREDRFPPDWVDDGVLGRRTLNKTWHSWSQNKVVSHQQGQVSYPPPKKERKL